MTDHSDLKAKAEAATPGPWSFDEYGNVCDSLGNYMEFGHSEPDDEYIAAASPDVVLALLAENERLQRELAAVMSDKARMHEGLVKQLAEMRAALTYCFDHACRYNCQDVIDIARAALASALGSGAEQQVCHCGEQLVCLVCTKIYDPKESLAQVRRHLGDASIEKVLREGTI